MNDVLQLKGDFFQKPNSSRPGAPNLPKGTKVNINHLKRLQEDLERLYQFWNEEKIFQGALISVFYTRVVPKSRRINGFLSKGSKPANSSIVGARFSNDEKRKHIITHYVTLDILEESINRVRNSILLFKEIFNDNISQGDLENIKEKNIDFHKYKISKTNFLKIIVDSHYVEKFSLIENKNNFDQNSIITIYKTDVETSLLMERIGIKLLPSRIIDGITMLLDPSQFMLLYEKAPYLIAMVTEDISKLTKDDFSNSIESSKMSIPRPTNEPIVGVIDTMFDDRVYFSEWVEFKNMLSDDIPLEPNDYKHGTAVSSIIVDGANINPNLDDGCGRFRVRHFGVAIQKQFSSFSILKSIKEIVAANKDIKIWNLSLGSKDEINPNFISVEAAILDKLQYENDIIFIISGTNKAMSDNEEKAIGSPADSINSLVVNSVDDKNEPASYLRKGIVLSFFNKPDVSYYGGGNHEKGIRVCMPTGEAFVVGTSFAAPWITRKMAYLIGIIGLRREVAKALIIDSSTDWKTTYTIEKASILGHGVVPKRIEDVVKSQDDEIKFVLSGVSEKYDTYNYNIPVPIHKDKHPFVAKATLCYFPKCSRNQGVDYTNTELDISFGRINKNTIKSIDKNKQSIEDETHYLYEGEMRKNFRKWDNSKHIKEVLKDRSKAKKTYINRMWGISIKTKERLETKDGEGICFGVVITLKELEGVNRIDNFIQNCSLRGWLVNKINVENRIDIYTKANEEIEFE